MANENAYVKVQVDEEGRIKIDTNMSALGVVHIMASATQVIVQNQIEHPEQEGEIKEV